MTLKLLRNKLIPKNFKLKHDLLGLLKSQIKQEIPKEIRLSQISEHFKKYNEEILYDQLYVLSENEEIAFIATSGIDQKFMITPKGAKSFIDDVYPRAGETYILNKIYDYGKNILVIIAILTFILSTYQGCNNKKSIDKQEKKIDKLEKQVNSLQNYHNFYLVNNHSSKKDQ